MAMARRGSRVVAVDGVRYRWVVTGRADPEPGFAVERERQPRSVMIGQVTSFAVVTPGRVAEAIRAALAEGWDPTRPGPAFRLTAAVWGAPILTPSPPAAPS